MPSAKVELVEMIEDPVSPLSSPPLDKWKGILRRRLEPPRADLNFDCFITFTSSFFLQITYKMHHQKSACFEITLTLQC